MAKAKFGEIVVAMRGKLGGHIHSANRAGAYTKRWSKPINRKTSFQQAVRTFFTTLTQGWKGLTEAQRKSWDGVTLDFTKNDSLGQKVQLTGHQLYIAINRNLQTIGQALISIAPFKISVAGMTTFTANAGIAANKIELVFTPAIPVGTSFEVYATRPLSQGKSSNSQDYKLINIRSNGDASPNNIKNDYEAIFGQSWKNVGQKIFIKAKPVDEASGIEGAVSFASAVVVA